MSDLHQQPLAERLKWLMDNKTREDGSRYSLEEVAAALKGQVSKTYLFELLKGHKTNPSLEVLEALASFFDVSPQFFSRDPRYFVPPIPFHEVQVALRAHGQLDRRGKQAMDRLLAETLAEILAHQRSPKDG